jgi:hypothetical protein
MKNLQYHEHVYMQPFWYLNMHICNLFGTNIYMVLYVEKHIKIKNKTLLITLIILYRHF